MTRILGATLLALLALALGAQAASAASTVTILRDCQDDGALQGNYTPAELKQAREELAADQDQYSDCRDVLRRAELVGSAQNQGKKDRSSQDDSSSSGGVPPAAAGPTDEGSAPPPPPPGATGEDGRPLVKPKDADLRRLAQALKDGGGAVTVDGKTVHPGKANALSGDGELPGPLIIVLVLLAIATAGAGAAVLAGKRVPGRRAT